jgi:ethylmalonyl-CoA mutase
VLQGMRDAGIGEVPVIVGGIVPPDDEKMLLADGIARVFTPKDYDLTRVMDEIVTIVEGAYKQAA